MTTDFPTWLSLTAKNDGNVWVPLASRPLLVLVGLTGVGKSTYLGRLQETPPPLAGRWLLLPDRRQLTDRIIIPAAQNSAGEPLTPVQDRERRFALTRRYRTQYPGGMAHALTQLYIARDEAGCCLFDGLRGAHEVEQAAAALPAARFVVLAAPLLVRLERLLGRQDAFDRIDRHPEGRSHAAELGADSLLFTLEERERLGRLVASGEIPAAELQAKLAIVTAEARSYDQETTIAALMKSAPQRTLVLETNSMSPAQGLAHLRGWLGN